MSMGCPFGWPVGYQLCRWDERRCRRRTHQAMKPPGAGPALATGPVSEVRPAAPCLRSSPRGREPGAYSVAGRDVADRRGEEVRMPAGCQVSAGEGQYFGLRHPLMRGRDLPVLVGVLVAADDVEGDRAVQVTGDRGEIPALRVAAMLAH